MATFPCSRIWCKKLHSMVEWLNTFNLCSFYFVAQSQKKAPYDISITVYIALWNIKSNQSSLKEDCSVKSKCFLTLSFIPETSSSKLKIKEHRGIFCQWFHCFLHFKIPVYNSDDYLIQITQIFRRCFCKEIKAAPKK